MKASELIAELQKLIAEHGDLEVLPAADGHSGEDDLAACIYKYGPTADGTQYFVLDTDLRIFLSLTENSM